MLAFDSGQAPLRHTRGPAESCFLPDLTRFTGSRCAGPDPQRLVRVVPLGGPCLEREFSPPDVGLGYRAPRAPRLARSTREATRPRVPSCPLEGCESGRIGTLGKRVWGNSPWVRIPLPPLGRRQNQNACTPPLPEAVPDASCGFDAVRRRTELLSEAAYDGVHDVASSDIGRAPDPIDELGAGHRATGMFGERREHAELEGRELNPLFADIDGAIVGIEEPAVGDPELGGSEARQPSFDRRWPEVGRGKGKGAVAEGAEARRLEGCSQPGG